MELNKMKHIIRDRRLTPEEIAKYNKIREQVMQEFPKKSDMSKLRIIIEIDKSAFDKTKDDDTEVANILHDIASEVNAGNEINDREIEYNGKIIGKISSLPFNISFLNKTEEDVDEHKPGLYFICGDQVFLGKDHYFHRMKDCLSLKEVYIFNSKYQAEQHWKHLHDFEKRDSWVIELTKDVAVAVFDDDLVNESDIFKTLH